MVSKRVAPAKTAVKMPKVVKKAEAKQTAKPVIKAIVQTTEAKLPADETETVKLVA